MKFSWHKIESNFDLILFCSDSNKKCSLIRSKLKKNINKSLYKFHCETFFFLKSALNVFFSRLAIVLCKAKTKKKTL